jgi:hypothetical protein
MEQFIACDRRAGAPIRLPPGYWLISASKTLMFSDGQDIFKSGRAKDAE